ncbi:MAG TPA: ANTAR domain-containing protein [Microlunatus sp.]|nr:ANTAR domain-containing protein [Microlunatus sp.]
MTLLVRTAERMDAAADFDELWTVIAAEAAQVLGTGAKVMQYTGRLWVTLVGAWDSELDDPQLTPPTTVAPGVDGVAAADVPTLPRLVGGHSRSVLVTALDCAALRVPTRLVWTSPREDAFAGTAELAAQYTRLANRAVSRTHERIHLRRAVTARHRIGQAQGILMAHLGLSAVEAFDVLLRRSQDTNVKLNVLADRVIVTGALDSPDSATARRSSIGAPERTLGRAEDGPLDDERARVATRPSRSRDRSTAPESLVVAAELADALSEAVITGTDDASGRAEIMFAVVEEMRASVAWLNDTACLEELRSLQATVSAAHQHLGRMLRLAQIESDRDLDEA